MDFSIVFVDIVNVVLNGGETGGLRILFLFSFFCFSDDRF